MTEIQVNDKVVINSPHYMNCIATVKEIGFSDYSDSYYYIVETDNGSRTKCMGKHITKIEEVSRTSDEVTVETFDEAVMMLSDPDTYRNSGLSEEAVEELIDSVMTGAGLLRNVLFESEDEE